MKKLIVIATLFSTGCASGLNSMQNQELLGYEAKGLAIEEKSTATAAALGFLPGGGSFYTRNYGIGAINLLLWPYSVLWDPISGYNGAQEINYFVTTTNVNKIKNSEVSALDKQLMLKEININQYVTKKREVENKYSPSGTNN
ncbi:MAG: hypothetical protein ACOYM1_03380 [Methylovulum sp.]|jgi:hypothetical protein